MDIYKHEGTCINRCRQVCSHKDTAVRDKWGPCTTRVIYNRYCYSPSGALNITMFYRRRSLVSSPVEGDWALSQWSNGESLLDMASGQVRWEHFTVHIAVEVKTPYLPADRLRSSNRIWKQMCSWWKHTTLKNIRNTLLFSKFMLLYIPCVKIVCFQKLVVKGDVFLSVMFRINEKAVHTCLKA